MKEANGFKEKVTPPPVLTLPRAHGQCSIDTGVCDTKAECVLLLRKEDKVPELIDFRSGSLRDAKRRYDTTDKGFLVVI